MVSSAPPAPAPDRPRFAIILAGGSGRRLGDVDKPDLIIDGCTLVSTALTAVAGAHTVVVGPTRDLDPAIRQTREHPIGGGPAAGLVAGLRTLTDDIPAGNDLVAVLAADLPGITGAAVQALCVAVRERNASGAVLTDPDGRRQYLAGVWQWEPLLAAANARDTWHDGRLSDLLGPLIDTVVEADRMTTADIDTPDDLLRWSKSGPTGTSDRD